MGWHKIDPKTGAPPEHAQSALSRPPDFVLLNAVPGIDDDKAECYLGDGPWDMASAVPGEIEAVLGKTARLSDDQIRDLLLRRAVPSGLPRSKAGVKLLQVVDAFWRDIDSCYEEDWDRPAKPAEKHWICEDVIASRASR
jgi:hypothetical protein